MAVTRRFADIDLSQLADLPAQPGYDAIYAARMSEIADRLRAAGIPYDVEGLHTDTVAIGQRASAYRETLVYAAQDAAIRAGLLATSWGVYLDHLGAGQVPPVERLTLIPATATAAAVMETDDDFRARIQIAPEALSTCGPEGAYLFYALAVPGVRAASCYGPMSFGGTRAQPFVPPGEVHVVIVSAEGDGTASPDLIAAVQAALSSRDRRPLGDFVTVVGAQIVPYAVRATLTVGGGADRGLVAAQALARVQRQADRQHRPGAMQRLPMLGAAAYVPDTLGRIVVEEVAFTAPATDINAGPITPASPAGAYRAPYCTAIDLRVEVADG